MPLRRSFKKLAARVATLRKNTSRDKVANKGYNVSDDTCPAPLVVYQLPVLDAGPDLSGCYDEELESLMEETHISTSHISTPTSSPLLIPRDFKNRSQSASTKSDNSETFSDIVPSTTGPSSPSSIPKPNKACYIATPDKSAVQEDEINKVLLQQLPFEVHANSHSETCTSTNSRSSQSSNEDPFTPVLEALDNVGLQAHAIRVRRDRHEKQNVMLQLPQDLACKVSDQTMHGSYNVLLTLEFSDGQRWLARIPGQGLEMSELDQGRMVNEYQTMRYVKANYPIPVPEVYFWTVEKTEIGVPCALIELAEGMALDEVWDSIDDQGHIKILDRIAGSMVELAKHRFQSIGTLQFDDSEHYTGLGPIVRYLNTTYAAGRHQQEIGPFENLQQQLIHASIFNSFTKHDQHILMLAINSIPNYMLSNGSIALSFPDLNSQNIMVDEYGRITSFLDWDRVATSPMSTGCARYPIFLMDDWDPLMFDMDEELVGEQMKELARYRLLYSHFYATHAQAKSLQGYDPRMTELSHILFTIELMVYRREQRLMARDELLHHAFQGTPPFTVEQYAAAFNEHSNQNYDDMMIEAFKTMWVPEWDREGWSWGNSISEAVVEESSADIMEEADEAENNDRVETQVEEISPTIPETKTESKRSSIKSRVRSSWRSFKQSFTSKMSSRNRSSKSNTRTGLGLNEMKRQQSAWLCRRAPINKEQAYQ